MFMYLKPKYDNENLFTHMLRIISCSREVMVIVFHCVFLKLKLCMFWENEV